MNQEEIVYPPKPIVDTSLLREVANGVFVIEDRRVPLVCNIGIIVGSHSVLVVDCGMGRGNGERVLEVTRRLAGSRDIYLTLTHFHPEHGFGAEAFKGSAKIIYNRAQADELALKGEAYFSMFSSMSADVAEALADTKLVQADKLYDDSEHEIDLGGRKALLKTWGKAHTRSDQVVFLPGERVLFTGDLAEEKTFPIFPWFPPHDTDIDANNWTKALTECILLLKPKIVVPGHGETGGEEILTGVRDYISDVETRVAAMAGRTVDEIIAAIEYGIRAAHPDWHAPEWIVFAIRYFASRQAGTNTGAAT